MRAATYFLSADCFVCKIQGYWIILSANHDKYLCVTHADLTSISRWLHGWQEPSSAAEYLPHVGVEADTLIASLMSNGIITTNARRGKPFAQAEYPASESAIEVIEPATSVKRLRFPIARFFMACARVDWHLRRRQLFRMLARIERRRLRHRSPAATHNVIDLSRLIAAFRNLRPLYPRPYLCLFDSLALLEFLASYRSFPHVVFGVVADPFQAHCWLQEDGVVLNDDLERVRRFEPILSM